MQVKDVANDDEAKALMKSICDEGKPLPLIANVDRFCGDYEAFQDANEDDELFIFLKLDH